MTLPTTPDAVSPAIVVKVVAGCIPSHRIEAGCIPDPDGRLAALTDQLIADIQAANRADASAGRLAVTQDAETDLTRWVLLVIASLCLLGLLLLGLGDLYRVGGTLTSDHLAGAAASFATRNCV